MSSGCKFVHFYRPGPGACWRRWGRYSISYAFNRTRSKRWGGRLLFPHALSELGIPVGALGRSEPLKGSEKKMRGEKNEEKQEKETKICNGSIIDLCCLSNKHCCLIEHENGRRERQVLGRGQPSNVSETLIYLREKTCFCAMQ